YSAISLLRFSNSNHNLEIKTYVFAEEDILVLELENRGKRTIRGEMNLLTPAGEASRLPSEMIREVDYELQVVSREFEKNVEIETKAACALRVFGAPSSGFNINSGEKMYAVLSSSSNFKSDNCTEFVLDRVKGIKEGDFIQMERKHKEWWSEYWNKSFVMINDTLIEKAYYRALYLMGSSSRDLDFPPGIFGTWITKERPEWNGDYHTNYNHMAPFYGLFSANRIEQALPYNYPIIAFEKRARRYSQEHYGIDGIYMPVGIGPKGIDVTYHGPDAASRRQFYIDHGFIDAGGLFFHQRSNALHCINNMAMLCYHTYNKEYIRLVYPFIKGVVEFWEGYLTFEDGRYIAYLDAVHEGPTGDTNNTMTLGFLRNALQTLIDMSRELNVDQNKVPDWEKILNNLSNYATYKKDGKIYVADSEKGYFSTTHTISRQIVFPGGQVHKDSDPELLELFRNSALADANPSVPVDRRIWSHQLHTSSDYPSAVRLGLDPDTILNNLKKLIAENYIENGFLKDNPVGIENCGAVPATINEMLLRSRPGVIEVFPVWNWEKDAIYQDLRAEGGFLVSSRLVDGSVNYIKITSEQGKDCHIVNPWFHEGGKTVSIIRNGKEEKMDVGERFIVKTSPDDLLIIMA
ncbi:MAG: hypothetical protein IH594_16490, partial [Bacteroidales bacterium]|nr:hypothetical protein [Bacteroidales bacterium]